MGHENPHYVGTQILQSDSPVYAIESHGDLGATFNSMVSADLPEYTAKFYSPTEHEQLSEVKYSKLEIGYEKGLREIHEAIQGIPLEFYTPHSVIVPEGGAVIEPKLIKKEKSAIEEIEKAQREVVKGSVKEVEVDELILRRFRERALDKDKGIYKERLRVAARYRKMALLKSQNI
jgi:hypothetical protein|tara:strand:+ start:245 stop:772 length:528 start_codon:yes stop_codon:yes gene_type:complete